MGAAGICEASGEVVFVLDDSSGAAVLWLLSVVEVVFTFDESLGTGATFGVEDVLGVMPCVALVEVAGAGVASGITTGGGVGLGLAAVSELLRLQPTKDKGKLIDRRVMRNLFLLIFIDVPSLLRVNTVELIYFPTLSSGVDRGSFETLTCLKSFTEETSSSFPRLASGWSSLMSHSL